MVQLAITYLKCIVVVHVHCKWSCGRIHIEFVVILYSLIVFVFISYIVKQHTYYLAHYLRVLIALSDNHEIAIRNLGMITR